MARIVGSYGALNYNTYEIKKISVKSKSGYIDIPVIDGFPKVHKVGDELTLITVLFRFDSTPTIGYSYSASNQLNSLRRQIGSISGADLILGGEDLGKYLVQEITHEVIKTAGNNRIMIAEANVVFKENPV